jgi:hypothetical protein
LKRALAVVAALLAVACGRSPAVDTAPGPSVPTSIAPRTLQGLNVAEDPSAAKAFQKVKASTLAADTRLYAIRKGATLVATLQITTVRPKVRLERRADREQIVSSVLSGAVETIHVNGVTVYAFTAEDRVIFVWFAQRLFEALQVKATKVPPRTLLDQILAFQTASPAWEPLRQRSSSAPR